MTRSMMVVTGVVAIGLATAAWAGGVGFTQNAAPAFEQNPPPRPPRDGDDEVRWQPPRDDNQDRARPRDNQPQPGRMFGPPGGGMGGTQMQVSGNFVYILRGDELMVFAGGNLELIKKIKLPPPERHEGDGRGDGPPRPPRD